ncbi:MAG: hypothetical protein M3R55_08320 [Acidobacteriota bacterium]|nr:hypothetical protein [Acidobacteriota bacterium]
MESGYQQARQSAAFDERRDRGRVRLSGADARSFLHAQLTNDIQALAPGAGCYAALLTPQGRMISDMAVLHERHATALWAVVPVDLAAALASRFDRSIFTEDVSVLDQTAATAHFSITGPGAREAADRALRDLGCGGVMPALLRPYDNDGHGDGDGPAIFWISDDLEPGGVDIAVPATRGGMLRDALARVAAPLSPGARLALRLETGRPEFHVDMTADTIPLEANLLDRAISTSKGCYVGQEVIIRVLHRGGGRVAKRLMRLRFDGGESDAPQAGAVLSADAREVGTVTSAAWSPRDAALIGLGYVHRDYAREDAALTLAGGRAAVITGA